MKLIKEDKQTHFIKEYDWETPPYEDYESDYWLWVHHDKTIKLSNTSDCCETIDLASIEAIDELIERLNKAKELFNKR